MKKRIIAAIMIIAMMFVLVGCDFDLPFLSKPEDAVNEFMAQESLIELLSLVEESYSEEGDYADRLWHGVFTSASIKALLLDNVRSISYNITNTKEYSDYTTITAMITHLDMTPIAKSAIEEFANMLIEMDAKGEVFPENEDEIYEMMLRMLTKCLTDAAAKTKPLETYSKIQFKCEKNSGYKWELKEIPEEFFEKVLLMNIDSAYQSAFENVDYFD